jgi:hypothetical protein
MKNSDAAGMAASTARLVRFGIYGLAEKLEANWKQEREITVDPW